MSYNLDDEKEDSFKKEDDKRKQERCDNLDDGEKEQLKNMRKKDRKLCVIT